MTPSPALSLEQPTSAPAPVAAPSEVRRGRGIFTRVLTFGLVVSLLPLGGLGIFVIARNTTDWTQLNSDLRLAVLSDAKRAIRTEMRLIEEDLTGMGHILLAPSVDDGVRHLDMDQSIALVAARLTQSSRLDHVTVYDATGHLAGTIKAKESATPSHPSELDSGVKELANGGKLVLWRLHTEGGTPSLDLLLPVLTGGVLRGYLATTVDLVPLCKLLADLSERRLSITDGLYVVDESRHTVLAGNTALAAQREDRAGKGVFGVALGNVKFANDFEASPDEAISDDGRVMAESIATLPEFHWAIVARQPRDIAFAALDNLRWLIRGALVLAALLAIVIAAVVARRLTRPIQALSEATRALAARTFSGLPKALTGRGDELGLLSRSFVKMVGDLEQSEAKLVEETRVRSSLSRYLAPDVVDLIVKDPHRLRLSGERREVTVLFADVVAFTKLAENRTPEEVVALLNELFTVATEIIQKNGGIVDKFIGDCVMAVWGAPDSHEDDAVRALTAAETLRRWLDTANRRWRSKFGVEIRLGMGVHTGTVVAGNLGSEKRMEYTVIGDAVNVAARLEGIAQPGQILLSEATMQKVGDAFEIRPAGERTIAGRSRAEIVYELAE